MFNFFKKKSMDELLLEALTPCSGDCDPMYDSYFQSKGEDPRHAKLAWALSYIIEAENTHQKLLKTQSFINNFFPYLQKKSRKIQDSGNFLRFLGLTYRVYERLAQRSETLDVSPTTLARTLDLGASGIISLHKHVKKTTSFKSTIESYQLERALRKDVSYFIDVCSRHTSSDF